MEWMAEAIPAATDLSVSTHGVVARGEPWGWPHRLPPGLGVRCKQRAAPFFFGGGVGGRLSRNSLAGGRMSTAMDFSFRKCRLRPSLRPGGMIAVRPWLRSSATIPPVFRHETSDLGGVVAVSAFQLTPPPRPNAPPCVRVSFWVASTAKPRPPWRADWGVGGWRPGQKRRARKGHPGGATAGKR